MAVFTLFVVFCFFVHVRIVSTFICLATLRPAQEKMFGKILLTLKKEKIETKSIYINGDCKFCLSARRINSTIFFKPR